MHQIEPLPHTTLIHEQVNLKVDISNDCHRCYFIANRLKCTHIKCSKKDRKDGNNIILVKNENLDK